jgi:hypothetical protein
MFLEALTGLDEVDGYVAPRGKQRDRLPEIGLLAMPMAGRTLLEHLREDRPAPGTSECDLTSVRLHHHAPAVPDFVIDNGIDHGLRADGDAMPFDQPALDVFEHLPIVLA